MSDAPISLRDYEARAKLSLPHNHWEFIEAGAMTESTTRRNTSAFEDLKLRPRFLRDRREPEALHYRPRRRNQPPRHGLSRRRPQDRPPRRRTRHRPGRRKCPTP